MVLRHIKFKHDAFMRFIYLLLMLVPLQIRGQMSLTELYQTCWTGVDKLLLENGDTLKDLSRLQTKRDFAIQTFPIDTLSKSLPAYTTDSVFQHLASTTQRFEELVVRWYAKGYRYPVLETYALYKKNANGKELERMH